MSGKEQEWMSPVEALTRFDSVDISMLDLDIGSETVKQVRYGFRVGSIGILVPENTLCEVMTEFIVYPVPNTQTWMRGLLNLRGNLIPVYDMSLLLEFSTESANQANLIILDSGADSVALLSESLPKSYDITEWKKPSRPPCMATGITDFVNEVYSDSEIIWIGFDYRNYFKLLREMIAA